MTKSKFGKLDIQRSALELNERLAGYWVNNIYDVDSKTFLIKLTQPGNEKELVVIESGVRFHLTKFHKEKSDVPSGFSMKLRKHIRQKRLISVTQLGSDRVVDFTFGLYDKIDSQYHIIVEMYAQGNVVLTDHSYQVLSLIRFFKDDEVRFAVGENYLEAIRKGQDDADAEISLDDTFTSVDQLTSYLQACLSDQKVQQSTVGRENNPALAGKRKKQQGSGVTSLKNALSMRNSVVNTLGPDLIEHSLLLAGVNPGTKLTPELVNDTDVMEAVTKSLLENSKSVLERLRDLKQPAGYLILEPKKADAVGEEFFFDRFDPILLEQYKSGENIAFETLNEAVDEYFSKIDAQREEKSAIAHRKQASKKVESIKLDQAKRIEMLELEILKKEQGAEAIAHDLENVDRAILIVRSAVASGMSWDELNELISTEKAKQNPIALLIESTKLESNEIVLRLPMPDQYQDPIRPAHTQTVLATVDINESAFANVSSLYSNKKQAVSKAERTAEAAAKVLEDAERKFKKDMEKHERGRTKVRLQRKVNWFEKFNWFITSEGFLVISGRDAQQNELIVKKFLRKSHGDIYVHADLHGASTCVVRSPRPGVSIPPESLRQAGAMTVCQSSAWNAKIITSAWWVNADQVSKTAPTGEYLSTGSFMIRGKKNFLPPCRLELTFGLLFKLDDTQESFDNRRVDWRVQQQEGEQSGELNEAEGDDIPHASTPVDGEGFGESSSVDAALEHRSDNESEVVGVEDSEDKTENQMRNVIAELEIDHDEMDDLEKPQPKAPAVGKADEVDAPKQEPNNQAGKDQKEKMKGSGKRSGEKPAAQEQPKKTGQQVRGKKGKLKKMKKKYRNQTEEDRILAMTALGHKFPKEEDTEVNNSEEQSDSGLEGVTASPKQSRSNPPKAPKKPKAEEETQEDEDVDLELNLKSFTCNPQEDDVILYAIPFCSPPQSTNSYKFRVKLTPGTMKKGKAAKQAQEVFARQANATSREKDLITLITDNEMVRAMQGNVKVNAPGVNNTSKQAIAAKQAKRIKKPRK